MRIRTEALNDPKKRYYWVIESWPGFTPTLSYSQQAELLRRYVRSLEYVESGWDSGKVVMMFQLADRGGIIQLVAADSAEDFAAYLKTNEAHILLAPDAWRVIPMVDWDSGKDVFLRMISRLSVRALHESRGEAQPSSADLDVEALEFRNSGQLSSLFSRLGA